MCFADDKYDLVLLDLMLLGKTGLDVLSEIRANSLVPVIAPIYAG